MSAVKHQCNKMYMKYGKSSTKLSARDRHTWTNIISYNTTTQLENYDTSTVVFKLHSWSKFLKFSTLERKKSLLQKKRDR